MATMKEFVRGYADSDGSVVSYEVRIHGAEGHRDVLEYTRRLCRRLGMRVGRIRPDGKPGVTTTILGRVTVNRQQGLRFSINASDFLRIVGGFNHSERQRKLLETIKGRRWTPWPAEVRERALKLRKEGWSYRRIAKELGVPEGTVRRWVKYGARTWQEYEARRRRPHPLLSCRSPSAHRITELTLTTLAGWGGPTHRVQARAWPGRRGLRPTSPRTAG